MGLGIKIPKSALTAGREKFAKGDDNDNVELDPGKYIFQTSKVRGVDTKTGAQIVVDFQLLGEEKKGKIGIFYSLAEDRIVYLFRFLALLGYDVAELDDAMLEEIVQDIETTKPVVRIKVSKKDDFTNYRVEKLIVDPSAVVDSTETESAVDENAGSVTAGRDVEQVKPAVTAPKPAPVAAKPAANITAKPAAKAAPKPAPAPVPAPPTDEEAGLDEEVVLDDEPPAPVVEEETVLAVGLKCKANLTAGVMDVEILELHDAEGMVTARGSDGRKRKFSIEKLM